MKSFLSFVLVMAALSLCGGNLAHAADNPFAMKLPFREATIHYTISGSGSGSETLYLRDHGNEQARYSKTTQKVMFTTTTVDQIEITTPDWIYVIDRTAQTGSKSVNPVKFMIEEYNRLSPAEKKMVRQNAEKMGSAALQGMRGEVRQNAAKILGYDCDLTSIMGTEIYTMHDTGIPLKSTTSMMGVNVITEATSVDKGPVAAHYFTPPAGIRLEHNREADQMARSMAKSTLDMLKSPDAMEKMKAGVAAPMMMEQGQYNEYRGPSGEYYRESVETGNGQGRYNEYRGPSGEYYRESVETGEEQGQAMEPGMQKEMNEAMEALRGIFGN